MQLAHFFQVYLISIFGNIFCSCQDMDIDNSSCNFLMDEQPLEDICSLENNTDDSHHHHPLAFLIVTIVTGMMNLV